MQRRMSQRSEMTWRRPRARSLWLVALCCALAACAGGSGSSGFDALLAENTAIQKALDTDGCEVNEGLTICASGGAPPPISTPTSQPEPTFTATPTRTGTRAPTASPTPTTSLPRPSFTATLAPTGSVEPTNRRTRTTTPEPPPSTPTTTPAMSTFTPTPTATPIPVGPSVDTNVAATEITCQSSGSDDGCIFLFRFQPEGFPSDAAYRVALRTRNPDGPWLVMPAVDNSAPIEVDDRSQFQIAVLVFLPEPPSVPESVSLLADTGADFAFVTPVLTAQSF